MKKRLALLLAGAMLCTAALTGCGGTGNDDGQVNGYSQAGDNGEGAEGVTTTDKTTLVMATNAAFPPYEFYEGGEIVGIDAEIAGKIAEKLGLELDISDMDFNSVVVAVQTGQADIGMAGMTVTETRLESVNFTDSYATGVQVIVVAEGSDIAGPDDLEGKIIGVQEATTGHLYCADDYGDDFVTAYTTGANAIEALKNGQVDAVVIDNEPAKAFVEANEGLVILDTEYAVEDYAIAISKDNVELMEAINEALNELIADGTVQSIIDKYIGA